MVWQLHTYASNSDTIALDVFLFTPVARISSSTIPRHTIGQTTELGTDWGYDRN